MRRLPLLALLLLAGCAGAFSHPEPDPRWLDPATGLAGASFPAALPANRPLRVAVFGDAQGNREATRAVVAAIRAARPDVVIFLGDALDCLPAGHMPDLGLATLAVPCWGQYQRGKPAFGLLSVLPFPALLHETLLRPVAPVRDPEGWNMFLEETAGLRLEDRVPMLFVPGNHDLYHDADREAAARMFAAPSPQALWRAFDVGPFRFVGLDTGSDLRDDADPLDGAGAQAAWLEAQLAAADREGRHVVLCAHFPPYTSSATDPPSPVVRDRLGKGLLARHRVALVLSGHTHAYERFAAAAPDGRETAYVVTGGAGGPFHRFDAVRRDEGSRALVRDLRHFVLLELSAEAIRGRMIPVGSPEAYVRDWHEAEGDEFELKLK